MINFDEFITVIRIDQVGKAFLEMIFYHFLNTVLEMLRSLLEKPAPVDDYVEWMDRIVERRIVKVRKYFRLGTICVAHCFIQLDCITELIMIIINLTA